MTKLKQSIHNVSVNINVRFDELLNPTANKWLDFYNISDLEEEFAKNSIMLFLRSPYGFTESTVVFRSLLSGIPLTY